jgi:hypothetical protein
MSQLLGDSDRSDQELGCTGEEFFIVIKADQSGQAIVRQFM